VTSAKPVTETGTSRRTMLIGAGGMMAAISLRDTAIAAPPASATADTHIRMNKGSNMNDKAEDPRVTRARLSGPEQVTKDATIAELKRDGSMTVLVKGTNEWVCALATKTISATRRCA